MLETISADSNEANYNALRKGLRELGYVGGENLHFEYRLEYRLVARLPSLTIPRTCVLTLPTIGMAHACHRRSRVGLARGVTFEASTYGETRRQTPPKGDVRQLIGRSGLAGLRV
jgi:hypothetical protein